MYAVIKAGGKQYRVTEGDTLKIEKLNVEPGSNIELEDVLLVVDGADIKVGHPRLDQAKIEASVIGHGRHKKIRIVKFRRRKHHRKQMGHRQYFTEIKIGKIHI